LAHWAFELDSDAKTRGVGAWLVGKVKAGDLVLLYGDLGAGKTTLVRGYLKAVGYYGDVRSPTFNLLSVYDTDPPVAHADLYRLKHWRESGLEEYLDTHVCFIEWPERAPELEATTNAVRIRLEFRQNGRHCTVTFPE
jgi:tRNA threonylcarbamoyladenosine biosynthesis protein TsaE